MFLRLSCTLMLAVCLIGTTIPATTSAAEKTGWSWNKLNPFHRDETPLIRPGSTRKIAPNRFKPTRSAAKPKKSAWKTVGDGTKKMVDGTKKLFTFGGSDEPDPARRSAPPILKPERAKKKTSLTSWLPWSKTKKR